MFEVHAPKQFTGEMRIRFRPSRVQCELLWSVTRQGAEVCNYTTWKDATDADVLEAYYQPLNDNQKESIHVLAK